MSVKSVQATRENRTEPFIPLNKLKKSPKNARKVPNSEAAIEAYAAEGILQNLVVEPEVDAEGTLTGFYFVDHRGRQAACPAAAGERIHAIRYVTEDVC
jgi:ParB family chromosome partitioning protein